MTHTRDMAKQARRRQGKVGFGDDKGAPKNPMATAIDAIHNQGANTAADRMTQNEAVLTQHLRPGYVGPGSMSWKKKHGK